MTHGFSAHQETINEIVSQSEDWRKTLGDVKMRSSQGSLPPEYQVASEAVEESYSKLGPTGKREVQQLPNPAHSAILVLTAQIARQGEMNGGEAATQVADFVSTALRQAARMAPRMQEARQKQTTFS